MDVYDRLLPALYTPFRTSSRCSNSRRRRGIRGESLLQRARARSLSLSFSVYLSLFSFSLARFHSYSRPVTTSRIIRPSGITNDVEGTPQAPPPLLCTRPAVPLSHRPFLSLIVPLSLSLARARALALLTASTHTPRISESCPTSSRESISGWFAESIRRNVALTGSFERRRKKRQASHKHL